MNIIRPLDTWTAFHTMLREFIFWFHCQVEVEVPNGEHVLIEKHEGSQTKEDANYSQDETNAVVEPIPNYVAPLHRVICLVSHDECYQSARPASQIKWDTRQAVRNVRMTWSSISFFHFDNDCLHMKLEKTGVVSCQTYIKMSIGHIAYLSLCPK